jgi:lysophospholipase
LKDGAEASWLESFDGGRLRVMRFGLEGPRGTALIVPGWAEPSEKYAEVALDLADRGFTPIAYDPRGQGMSARCDQNDERGRLTNFSQLVKDLGAVTETLADGPLVILGHSMGGLTTLSWLAGGGKADAAVLSAPATRIFANGLNRFGVRALTRGLCLLGFRDLPLSKEGGMALAFEGNTLTSDEKRHAYLRDLLLTEEGLTLPRTNPSMVSAMHAEQKRLTSKGALDDMTVPTRIVSLPQDEWVDAGHHHEIAGASALIDLVEVPGSKHEILMEADDYRDAFWDAFDEHVDRYIPRSGNART